MNVGADPRGLRFSDATLRRLAATVGIVSLALGLASLALFAIEIGRGNVNLDQVQTTIVVAVFAIAFPTVGWIVVRRLPTNLVGWVYLAVGFWQALNLFASGYSTLAFEVASGNLPLAPELSWLAVWAWAPGFALFSTLGVLLFPDGHLPSRRWLPVVGLSGVALGLLAVPMAIATWSHRGIELEQAAQQSQPVIPAGSGLEIAFALSFVGQIVLLVAMAGAVAGLVSRFRRANGVERQQLKWFMFAALFDVLVLIVWTAGLLDPLQSALSAFVFAPALPVGIGIAILRYRLYDIDRIISRTLVYGVLTAALAGLYAASVGLMQRVSRAVTGADSDAAIILTTLIVVTAFTPVKSWLQHVVDRRFEADPDPKARLQAFTDQLLQSVSPLDSQRTLRRFLAVVTEACKLEGGTIDFGSPGSPVGSAAQGTVGAAGNVGRPRTVLSASSNGATLRLELVLPARRAALSSRDRAVIEDALAIVATELGPAAGTGASAPV